MWSEARRTDWGEIIFEVFVLKAGRDQVMVPNGENVFRVDGKRRDRSAIRFAT